MGAKQSWRKLGRNPSDSSSHPLGSTRTKTAPRSQPMPRAGTAERRDLSRLGRHASGDALPRRLRREPSRLEGRDLTLVERRDLFEVLGTPRVVGARRLSALTPILLTAAQPAQDAAGNVLL